MVGYTITVNTLQNNMCHICVHSMCCVIKKLFYVKKKEVFKRVVVPIFYTKERDCKNKVIIMSKMK